MSSLHELVAKQIELMRTASTKIVSTEVASAVVEAFPHRSQFNEAEFKAAYMGVIQVAREQLRARHDADYSPERFLQMPLALPESSLLNGAYSIKRGEKDDPVYLYVPIDEMSREDMEYVCSKFDALAVYAARHSRALRSYWERRNAAAA